MLQRNHYLCSLKQDVEAAVNLTFITKGHLSTPREQYNPETGRIKLCLGVKDPRWQPRLGLKKWDSDSRTFTEVGKLLIFVV